MIFIDLNIEFIRGILFVKVYGELVLETKNKFIKEIENIIDKTGINRVVIDFQEATCDIEGIKGIKILSKKIDNLTICNLNKRRKIKTLNLLTI